MTGLPATEPDSAWVEAADRLLYEAKADGRDRVAAAAGGPGLESLAMA